MTHSLKIVDPAPARWSPCPPRFLKVRLGRFQPKRHPEVGGNARIISAAHVARRGHAFRRGLRVEDGTEQKCQNGVWLHATGVAQTTLLVDQGDLPDDCSGTLPS